MIRFVLLILFFNFTLLSKPLNKINLQLQWKHQFEFAGFYMAKEKGFYSNVGIDVEFKEFESNTNIINKVLESDNTYGITYSNIVSSYLNGEKVTLIANFLKQSPLAIATSKDILSPKDLKGKKVMGIDESISNTPLLSMLKSFDVELKDINIIPASFDINDLINRHVDAMVVFTTNEIYKLNEIGFQYNLFKPSTYGVEFYDLNLFTSKKEANENPQRVRDFKNASIKGWEYAFNHIDETIEIILKKYNTQNKSKKHLLFEANQIKNATLSNIYNIGTIQEDRINLIANEFKNLGIVKNTQIDFEDFIFDYNSRNKPEIELTVKEKEYLKENPILKVSNETDWPPYDFAIDKKPMGYSIDYMELLSKKIGVKFEYVNGYSWEELVEMFCNGKIQLLHPTDKSNKVKECGNFSSRIIKDTTRYLTKKDFPLITNIEDLYGKKVASPKGWEQTEWLKKDDKFIVIEVENIESAVNAVSQGEADFTIEYGNVLNYLIRKTGFMNLKVQGHWNDNNSGLNELYIGTGKQNKELASIIQKAINQTSIKEIEDLQQKWFGIQYSEPNLIYFNKKEQEFIAKNKLTYCVDPIWFPIEYLDKNNIHQGISKDYLEIIRRISGLNIEYLKTTDWSDTLEKLKSGECDISFAVGKTPSREKYLSFSTSYMNLPLVVITQTNTPFILEIDDLKNKKIGMIKDFAPIENIKVKYPYFYPIEIKNSDEGLKMVSEGTLDGFIDFLPTVYPKMNQISQNNLRIGGKIDDSINLAIGTRKDIPLIQSILQKSLDSISLDERKRIADKWMIVTTKKEFDYSLIWEILIFTFFIIILILYVAYKFKSQVAKQIKLLSQKDNLLMQQTKNAAMGELIANIAHQWRQPLANINGIILNFDYDNENDKLDKKAISNYLNEIEKLNIHMSNTIENFTNYFSPDKKMKSFSLETIITDIKDILKYSLIKNNINITVIQEEKININSYYSELLQIFLIIINNSKDAFISNKIKNANININTQEKNNEIIINIEDNAGGIPIEIIDKIFEPYFTTKHQSQGTGLGLYMVKTILENSLNGNISVVNIDYGAKFTIILKK